MFYRIRSCFSYFLGNFINYKLKSYYFYHFFKSKDDYQILGSAKSEKYTLYIIASRGAGDICFPAANWMPGIFAPSRATLQRTQFRQEPIALRAGRIKSIGFSALQHCHLARHISHQRLFLLTKRHSGK